MKKNALYLIVLSLAGESPNKEQGGGTGEQGGIEEQGGATEEQRAGGEKQIGVAECESLCEANEFYGLDSLPNVVLKQCHSREVAEKTANRDLKKLLSLQSPSEVCTHLFLANQRRGFLNIISFFPCCAGSFSKKGMRFISQ